MNFFNNNQREEDYLFLQNMANKCIYDSAQVIRAMYLLDKAICEIQVIQSL